MFPRADHACHLTSPPTPIALQYQNKRCLNASFVNCPGIQNGWEDVFPKDLRGPQPKKPKKSPTKWVLFLVIGLLLSSLVIAAIFQRFGTNNKPIVTIQGGLSARTATQTIQATDVLTLTHTLTSTIEPSPVVTNTPPVIHTHTPGPGLQTPIGSNGLVLAIHQVRAGEVLDFIAEQYNTNSAVLREINQFVPPERTTLWEDDLIVICVGCEDTRGLPKLQAIFVESSTSLEELSETYNTSVEQLREWNDLGEEDHIDQPRWMIIRAY